MDNYRNFADSLVLGIHHFLHARRVGSYLAGDRDNTGRCESSTGAQDHVNQMLCRGLYEKGTAV